MGIAAAVVLITGGARLVMVQRRTTGSTTTVVTTLAPASTVEPAPAPSAPNVTVEDPPSSISSVLPTEPATGVTQVANHEELLDWVGTYTLVKGPHLLRPNRQRITLRDRKSGHDLVLQRHGLRRTV